MFIKILSNLLGRVLIGKKYASWSQARMHSNGYNSKLLVKKLKKIYLKEVSFNKKVKEFYERDGISFKNRVKEDQTIISFFKIINLNVKSLNVLDFGGSLGSVFFSNFNFFKKLKAKWTIVEQPIIAKLGKEILQKRMRFYSNFNVCLKNNKFNTILFSQSLQYLNNPYKYLKKIKQTNIKYIIIHGIPLSKNHLDSIHIQYVPKKIYECSYPINLFSEFFLMKFFIKNAFTILKSKELKSPFFGYKYKSFLLSNDKFVL